MVLKHFGASPAEMINGWCQLRRRARWPHIVQYGGFLADISYTRRMIRADVRFVPEQVSAMTCRVLEIDKRCPTYRAKVHEGPVGS